MEDLLRKVRRLRVYDRQVDLWPSPFLCWDSEYFLAQATWEWPEPWQPVDEAGCSIALVNDLKALEAFEARQKPHMERQFYGN